VPPVDRGGDGVSLGRPIANVRVYVVDERGALSPYGARGEIWIGGRPVARGYHRRRELTAERSFSDPFTTGGLVVRTGDAGRWRPDGQLEYLGRA
jgi:non-ribosomal peptide synthetase component F